MTRQEILDSLGDLTALAAEIGEINKANGWRQDDRFRWEDPHKIPSALALVHSEISEAWIGLTQMGEENYAEELADVAIRILDMLDGMGDDASVAIDEADGIYAYEPGDEQEALLAMHYWTTEALEEFRKDRPMSFPVKLGAAFIAVLDACVLRDINLSASIKAKLEKNRQRGYRHGNKKV